MKKEEDKDTNEVEIIPEPQPKNQLNFEEIDSIVLNIESMVKSKDETH